eukprot:Platyproteum_vivax@DN618_c0_g1_i1.p1
MLNNTQRTGPRHFGGRAPALAARLDQHQWHPSAVLPSVTGNSMLMLSTTFHDATNYLTALLWFLAYASLLQKLRRERSAVGLSLQSLLALVLSELNSVALLLAVHFSVNDSKLNWDFLLCDTLTSLIAIATLYTVIRRFSNSYESHKDTFGRKFCSIIACCGLFQPGDYRLHEKKDGPLPLSRGVCSGKCYWFFLYILAFAIAAPLFVFRRTGTIPPLLSAWECLDDSLLAVALIPQLFMFYNRRPRRVSQPLGRFVVLMLLARICSFSYWYTDPWFHRVGLPGRGVHLVTEALNILILLDFAYHFVKSSTKGYREVQLPI